MDVTSHAQALGFEQRVWLAVSSRAQALDVCFVSVAALSQCGCHLTSACMVATSHAQALAVCIVSVAAIWRLRA